MAAFRLNAFHQGKWLPGIFWLGLLLTSMVWLPVRAADPQPDDETSRKALVARLERIETERKASRDQFVNDKKACARLVLVSRCTTDALLKRRAREDVLARSESEARTMLRTLALRSKNRDLAASLPGHSNGASEEERKKEAQDRTIQKRVDLEERRAEQARKKAKEAENRQAWEAKQERSAQKRAESQARQKAAPVKDATPTASAN